MMGESEESRGISGRPGSRNWDVGTLGDPTYVDLLDDLALNLLDLAGFEAGGADSNSLGIGSILDAYTLNIRNPTPT